MSKWWSLCCLFFFAHAFAMNEADWTLIRSGEKTQVYEHKTQNDLVLSVYQSPQKSQKWSQSDGEKVFKAVISKKKEMLEELGVKDWKASDYTWKAGEQGQWLRVRGSYQNRRKKKVHFIEVHEFHGKFKKQYLYTREGKPIENRESLHSSPFSL